MTSCEGELWVLIEGGYRDDWMHNAYVRVKRTSVPADCTVVDIDRYPLTLVRRWENDQITEVDPLESMSGRVLDLGRSLGYLFERPSTLITSDGRIYHDLSLLNSEFNNMRLNALLDELRRQYGLANPLVDWLPDKKLESPIRI